MKRRKRLYFKKVYRPIKVLIELDLRPLVAALQAMAAAVKAFLQQLAERLQSITFEPIRISCPLPTTYLHSPPNA